MTPSTKFTALLFILQGLTVALGSKVQLADTLLYHPGHSPHHVTRLHRYEHAGIQSMLQEEARWAEQAQKHSARGERFKEVLLHQKHQDSEFVKLSDIQGRALRKHHQSWLQIADGITKEEKMSRNGDGMSLIQKKTLVQKFKADLPADRQDPGFRPEDASVVATSLSSLNSQYVGPIGVGTLHNPPGCVLGDGGSKLKSSLEQACTVEDQSKVWVVFDTGSTNIWIASDLCKSGACRLPGRHMFNHTASATFKYPESVLQLTVQFGTGRIAGPQAIDDFKIGPFTVKDQTFGMIEKEEGSVFHDVPFEGIVGMAFDKMSANHVQPFFSSIIQQKVLQHNEFSFYFSRDNPSANALLWGGVDKNFYEGKLEYFPVVDPYYWSLKLVNFKIGNDEILGAADTYEGSTNPTRNWKGPVALVDTGTTFFTAEGGKFGQVMSKLASGACKEVTDATHPPITITLENVLGQPSDFVLSNKQYMTQSGKGETSHCSPAFMQIDLPEAHGPGMVLGEIFLRHFFAVFDRDTGTDSDAKLAFARSSNKPEALNRLRELTADQPQFAQSGVASKHTLDSID